MSLTIRRNYMYDLTGFQRDLLYVVAELEVPHGLAIKEELKGADRADRERRSSWRHPATAAPGGRTPAWR